MMMVNRVAAFDFDHTIINVNSDTFIDKLVKKRDAHFTKYPDEIERLYDIGGWTSRMNGVFEYMHDKCGIGKQDLLGCLREIKIDASMCELIRELQRRQYEMIIVSDANDIFIEEILQVNGLRDAFSTIYTNRGEFVDDHGRLVVKPFNEIFNESGDPFDCSTRICTSNICKGAVLARHLDDQKSGERTIVYVGDGRNDYCPGLCLTKNDFYYVRSNHSLERLLKKDATLADKLRVSVNYWQSAHDILQHFKSINDY